MKTPKNITKEFPLEKPKKKEDIALEKFWWGALTFKTRGPHHLNASINVSRVTLDNVVTI
jgi:hypothetical protein